MAHGRNSCLSSTILSGAGAGEGADAATETLCGHEHCPAYTGRPETGRPGASAVALTLQVPPGQRLGHKCAVPSDTDSVAAGATNSCGSAGVQSTKCRVQPKAWVPLPVLLLLLLLLLL